MAETRAPGAENADLLKVLSDPANRAIVSFFNESPVNTASFSELSTFLVDDLPGERDESVILHHKCLPELSYFGLLEYDAERSTVEWKLPDVLQSFQHRVDRSTLNLRKL